MITKEAVLQHGYSVLPEGGWIYINPEIIPNDWQSICSDFGISEDAKGAYLCIVGVKEVQS
jgi:anti-sigma regulatory factor (Ser/Thr protein kinase)